jgi:hypothetical protein
MKPDKYTEIVSRLTRLTAEGKVTWSAVKPREPWQRGAGYRAVYKGETFLLRDAMRHLEESPASLQTNAALNLMSGRASHHLSVTRSNGTNIDFPRLEAVDSLAYLVRRTESDQLDELIGILG